MATVLDPRAAAPDRVPPPARLRLAPAEYLARELSRRDGRAEYLHGEAIETTGGTIAHCRLGRNLVRAFGQRLDDARWEWFGEGPRVGVRDGRFAFYPDACVLARNTETVDPSLQAIVEPIVVYEVLSPSTEAFDRGEKFACYRQFPSLQEYVLLAQDAPAVESYARRADGSWSVRFFDGLDADYKSEALGISIPLGELYAGVLEPVQE